MFGEDKADRRERLRQLLAVAGDDDFSRHQIEEIAKEKKKEVKHFAFVCFVVCCFVVVLLQGPYYNLFVSPKCGLA